MWECVCLAGLIDKDVDFAELPEALLNNWSNEARSLTSENSFQRTRPNVRISAAASLTCSRRRELGTTSAPASPAREPIARSDAGSAANDNRCFPGLDQDLDMAFYEFGSNPFFDID